MPERPNSNNNNAKKGCGRSIIILIILILIVFFWHFINYTDVKWTGDIANQTQPSNLPNDIPISDGPSERPAGKVTSYANTSTNYNCEYRRWSGKLKAGEYAAWGKISIEQAETPVGGIMYPLPPSRIYGNIREFNGVGVDLMIFSEENYFEWFNGNKHSVPIIINNGISDFNYSFGIDYGSYFIVVQNNSSDNEAFVGFTGVQVCQRVVEAGETPYSNPNPPNCYWIYKKEKLTIFEYILKILNPSNSVSETPPFIGKG